MADAEPLQPTSSGAGPSRSISSRPDMEGIGKFKVRQYPRQNAPPPRAGSSYKAKFFVLKETYDSVTARREELSRELDVANSKLKAIQEENDLLIDAMQIVAHTQPTLVAILQQMESEPLSLSEPEMYPEPPRHEPGPPPPPLPSHDPHPELIIDAASLNGNGRGHGYTHHAPVHAANGRSRGIREFHVVDEPADLGMVEDDAMIHGEEQSHAVRPP